MLDITLFREEWGSDPQRIRDSQRSRQRSIEEVDEVIRLDRLCRKRQFEFDTILRLYLGPVTVHGDLSEYIDFENAPTLLQLLASKQARLEEACTLLFSNLRQVGNLVHPEAPTQADAFVKYLHSERLMQVLQRNLVDLHALLQTTDTINLLQLPERMVYT